MVFKKNILNTHKNLYFSTTLIGGNKIINLNFKKNKKRYLQKTFNFIAVSRIAWPMSSFSARHDNDFPWSSRVGVIDRTDMLALPSSDNWKIKENFFYYFEHLFDFLCKCYLPFGYAHAIPYFPSTMLF